jgi:hypothetical protein
MNNQGLQPALNQYFSQEKRVSIPWYQTRAIERYHQYCTSALGGHAQFCENGLLNGVFWYNKVEILTHQDLDARCQVKFNKLTESFKKVVKVIGLSHHRYHPLLPLTISYTI